MRCFIVAITLLIATTTPVWANDGVYREPYRSAKVYQIEGRLGFVTTLHFAQPISAVTIGDPAGWDITPLRKNTVLSIKPIDARRNTNMTVIGRDGKSYSFNLKPNAGDAPEQPIMHRLEFVYPEDDAIHLANLETKPHQSGPEILPENLNFAYGYRGNADLRPTRAFDDGVKTYFQFPQNRRSPAIFTVGKNGQESLVNVTKSGQYYIVHTLARQFTFRDGDVVTCVYNTSYAAGKGYDGLSPREIAGHELE